MTVDKATRSMMTLSVDELRALLAEVWDDGYDLGVSDECSSVDNIGIAGMGMKVAPARENPYRESRFTERPETSSMEFRPAPIQSPGAGRGGYEDHDH